MDAFLSKLKEQSFTIILLVGIMWYQNNLFNSQMKEYKEMIKEKENTILQLTEIVEIEMLGAVQIVGSTMMFLLKQLNEHQTVLLHRQH